MSGTYKSIPVFKFQNNNIIANWCPFYPGGEDVSRTYNHLVGTPLNKSQAETFARVH